MVPATGEHQHQKALTRVLAGAQHDATYLAVLSPAGADGLIAVSLNGLRVGTLGRGNSATYAYLLADGPIEVRAHITRGPSGLLVDVALPPHRRG